MCTVFQLSTAEKTEKEEQERNQNDPAHVAKKTKTDHKGASKQQCGKTRKKKASFFKKKQEASKKQEGTKHTVCQSQ